MILILGGSGYIGGAFKDALHRRGLPCTAPLRAAYDATRAEGVLQLIDQVRPRWVVNAAGYTGFPNVDESERNKVRVLEANLLFAVRVAEACAARSIPLGHVSTGCIYQGRRPDGGGFREDDPPNFTFREGTCSFYSGTKALAETWVAQQQPQSWIWRLRRPFNGIPGPKNYLCKMARYRRFLEAENSISHLDDFIGAALDCLLRSYPFGIYHICNPGVVKTSAIVQRMQAHGLIPQDASFFGNLEEFRTLAGPTPRSECVLDSSRIIRCGTPLREVHEALEDSIHSLARKNGEASVLQS